jgi:hypothetical protein
MIYDGRWKLSKYATGEIVLFDLQEDPMEQINLAGERNLVDRYRQLDSILTQEILASSEESYHDRKVFEGKPPIDDEQFGKRGWKRPYPRSVTTEVRWISSRNAG